MASNHVQHPQPQPQPQPQPDQNGGPGTFGDGSHDTFNYNSIFSHAQEYGSNWAVDPSLQQDRPPLFQPTSSGPGSTYHPQPWQHTATSTPTATPTQQHATYSAPRGYYPPVSNASVPFQHTSPYAGQGLPQYGHALDPSLVSQSPADTRTFGQGVPSFSSASPSNTISPSALYSGPSLPLNQQAPPSKTQVGIQYPQSMRSASANGLAQPELPKAPKGTVSSNFLIQDFEKLAKATNSVRLHNFINLSNQQHELSITKSTIPPYVARKSQNELKALAAIDPNLRAKITKRVKKSKILVPKPGRPKPVNGIGRLSGSKESPISPSSDSESSDYDSDSSYDSDFDMAEPSPLPATRPQKPMEAVKYDTTKAVWLPRNVYAQVESIRTGLKEFWEVVKTIRDRWKTDSDVVKTAAEAKKDSELPLLRERVDNQREMMEVALMTAIEHGHHDVLRACGHVKPLILALYQFLAERIRDNDYDGSFTKTLLKFLSLCTGLNNELIEATNLNKVLTRFIKRGDVDVKTLSSKITNNAAIESKKTEPNGSKVVEANKLTKAVDSKDKDVKKEPQLAAGVKRPRPADGTSNPTTKRAASVATISTSTASKGGLLGVKRPATANSASSGAATVGSVKPKSHQVNPKAPANFFAGLQSASKKPGTSISAGKLKTPSGALEKKSATPAAAVIPAFSFAATMANLTREREPEVTSKPETKRPPETAEAKARRLRKEERSKLRVSWKPDAMLVEIREFSRDPSEMPGNASNVRDVRNGKEQEGLMFKQHMDMMDVDVDDDDDQPMEQTFFDFKSPTAIDFSQVDEHSLQNNYKPYGGGSRIVDSPERRVQENREASTLMVHYMVKSDIPSCPREPADPYTGERLETTMFGAPTEPVILDRLTKFAPTSSAVPDVSAILANLQNLLPQAQPQQPQYSGQDPNNAALQSLLAQASGTQYGYTMPQPLVPTIPVAEDLSQASAPADPNSIEAILARLNTQSQPQQQQQTQTTVPALQQYTSLLPNVTGAPLDPNALLAALTSKAQPQAYPAYRAETATDQYDNPDRKRYRETGNQQVSDNDPNKRPKWNNIGAKHVGPKFVVACKFWKKGECRKGSECTFKHE